MFVGLHIILPLLPGNYDVLQQPKNIGEEAKKVIPFYMFIDEETEMYMKNASVLDSSKRVGLWRIIVVHNVPYADARRNGKVSLLIFGFLFITTVSYFLKPLYFQHLLGLQDIYLLLIC